MKPTSAIISPRIIALVGAKRCGKDTIAGFLDGYTNYKISQRLKNICKEMFGFTDEELETDKKDLLNDRWGVTPRYILQVFGTEIAQFQLGKYVPKVQGRTFWIERFCEDLDAKPTGKIVITDMRFMHEYTYLRDRYKNGMVVVKVRRGGDNATTGVSDAHVSEQEWEGIPEDFTITNDATLEKLKNKTLELFPTK